MKVLKLLVVVWVIGLSAELLADQMLNFRGEGWLSDSKTGIKEYGIVLQVLNDGRGIHYHWLYQDDHGRQKTRNCFYLKEGFAEGVVEVLAPADTQFCLDTARYRSLGWGHRIRLPNGLESLVSYRDDSGGRFTMLLQENFADERLRVTGHYLGADGQALLQHWVDYLQIVHHP